MHLGSKDDRRASTNFMNLAKLSYSISGLLLAIWFDRICRAAHIPSNILSKWSSVSSSSGWKNPVRSRRAWRFCFQDSFCKSQAKSRHHCYVASKADHAIGHIVSFCLTYLPQDPDGKELKFAMQKSPMNGLCCGSVVAQIMRHQDWALTSPW